MKKITITLLTILAALLIWQACEEETPEPPVDETSKLVFESFVQDTVSYRTATFSYTIGNMEKNTVDELGICYANHEAPSLDDNTTAADNTNATGTISLENLEPGTEYFACVYTKLGNAASYSDVVSFQTTATDLPVLTTGEVTNIEETTATCSGNITDDNGDEITQRGFCWDTTSNFTLSTCIDSTNNDLGMGEFSGTLTELAPGTEYFVKAYATNAKGTNYGDAKAFTTITTTPGLTTLAVTNITETTAQSGGNIDYDGGGAVVARGVCWSTSQNPTIADNHTTDGSGTGSFTSEITGLNPVTQYFVRAYATNEAGPAYGEERDFTIPDGEIEITTTEITNITLTTATSGGNITSDGGFDITSRGVCWSTSPDPTIDGNHTTNGSGTGSFTSQLTGLSYATQYYVRVYATNEAGTTYGEERCFTTLLVPDGPGDPVTDIDGNTYETVWIGGQNWMAENLKATTYNNGSSIELVEDDTDWNTNSSGAYCWYDNDQAQFAEAYGALYNWYAVNTGNLCPSGWHVPTDEEWKTLEMELGMSQTEADNTGWRGTNEGSKLAGNATLWNDGALENDSEFGSSGFTALPGGSRHTFGAFYILGNAGSWWSATEYYTGNAWYRYLHYYNSKVTRSNSSKVYGFSVRCLRD